jgi:hypothetical protein
MSHDHDKHKPIDAKRDASDNQKPTTSQKTANEAVSSDTQAKRHSENFESLSHDTRALGQFVKAEQPLILHDSTTGETLYDASKRRSKVVAQVAGEEKHAAGRAGTAGEQKHAPGRDGTAGEEKHATGRAGTAGEEKHDAPHKSAGDMIVEMELQQLAAKHSTPTRSEPAAGQTRDTQHKSAGDKIVEMERKLLAEKHSDKVPERALESGTVRGDKTGLIKQDMSLWMPDYKSMASPMILPKLVEVRLTPEDNNRLEALYQKNLAVSDKHAASRGGKELSDFEKQNLRNLAVCDLALEKYQEALTKSTLNETRHMPDQVRGLMLAGAALEDGAAIGASKAVLHKVIQGGAIGDLASGTAMGVAFGKVVGTLAANVNPWTRLGARALQAGGLAMAIKEIGQVGADGYNGLMKSLPALQDCCTHPSEKTFAHAKAVTEDNLGEPLADGTLVGLGFAAAHGVEKLATRGGGRRGAGEQHETAAESADGLKPKGDVPEGRAEKYKQRDVQELPKLAHSGYECVRAHDDCVRILKCGPHELKMMKWEGWFNAVTSGDGKAPSPIKVHILTESAEDLARVQSALIPELMRDAELLKYVAKWKGMDPAFATEGQGRPGVVAPDGVGQGAKAFTIYTKTAEEAIKVQKRVDAILHAKGLSLKEELRTGNTEIAGGLSRRAAVSRDTFEEGRYFDPMYNVSFKGPVLDAVVEQRLVANFDLPPGSKLTQPMLSAIEQKTGLKPGTMVYGAGDRLMLKAGGGQSRSDGAGYYAVESEMSTTFGQLVERPALYALYRAVGVDPCEPAIIWRK